MRQTNKQYGTKKVVRRRPVFVSSADAQTKKFRNPLGNLSNFKAVPAHWDKTQIPETGFKRVSLQSSSAEYQEIESLFRKTMRGFDIVQIERIQNKALWEVFEWQKEQMKKNNSGRNVTERKLFHGTDSKHVDAICLNNLDWRICGTHGTSYGKGSYFARDAEYSHSYTGQSDVRSMFVSRVLVGDFTRGSSKFLRPPSKDGGDMRFYDSCVNHVRDPFIFVVFEKHQIYPEYLLQKPLGNQSNFKAVPAHWDKTQIPETGFKRVSLQSSSAEYQGIESLFCDTMRGFDIVQIERIQNKALWEVFEWQKEQMKKNNSGRNVTEIKLFHGTDSKHVDAICHNNFDWRICGTHGTTLGKGSYFARDATYSHHFTGQSDVKSMFVSRVLVGDFTRGYSDYLRPPSKDGGDTHFYDSCVDDVRNPSIFVVFEKHQIYPEYLLHYKEKTSNLFRGYYGAASAPAAVRPRSRQYPSLGTPVPRRSRPVPPPISQYSTPVPRRSRPVPPPISQYSTPVPRRSRPVPPPVSQCSTPVPRQISTPIKPVPSPRPPVSTPIKPVPSPRPPVSTPIKPVPSPRPPVSTLIKPVPSPHTPVSTPIKPVPSPHTPVSTSVKPVPSAHTPVPTLNKRVAALRTLFSTPIKPVPSPHTPVSTLIKPVPSPHTPVSTPIKPVPSPSAPVSTPIKPVPLPRPPVSTPVKPVPSPHTPVSKPVKPVCATSAPVYTPTSQYRPPSTPVSTPVKPVPSPHTPVSTLIKPVPSAHTPVSTPIKPVPSPHTPVSTSVKPVPSAHTPVPTLNKRVAALRTLFSTPIKPVPSPHTPVSTPVKPVPSPHTPVSKPVKPVPSPHTPVSTPVKPVPSPHTPVSTPVKPVPSPRVPVFTLIKPVPSPHTPVSTLTNPVPSQVPVSRLIKQFNERLNEK
uniref:uncharacterized protein n=1 Tax=Centroberyx gerrardi TaxID=166262 RepID=UPI003AAD2BC3